MWLNANRQCSFPQLPSFSAALRRLSQRSHWSNYFENTPPHHHQTERDSKSPQICSRPVSQATQQVHYARRIRPSIPAEMRRFGKRIHWSIISNTPPRQLRILCFQIQKLFPLQLADLAAPLRRRMLSWSWIAD